MGLFARLMQPAITSRYCLPYKGSHPMVCCILDGATHFLADLPKRHSTEEKLGSVLAFYAITIQYIKDQFPDSWQELYDFSIIGQEIIRLCIGFGFNQERFYWHPVQKECVESMMRQIDSTGTNKNVIFVAAMNEFNKDFLAESLKERNINATSREFIGRAMNFVLTSIKDNSGDDFLLMSQLGSAVSIHILGVGVVLSEIMDAFGKQRPIKI